MDNQRIIFVITSMGRGGAERVISILANEYAKLGWEVHIIMLWHSMVDYDLDARVEVIDLSNDAQSPYLRIPATVLRLRRQIKRIKPLSVVTFVAHNGIISTFACLGLKCKLITSERIDPTKVKRGRIFSAVLNWAYARSSRVVLQARRVVDYFPQKVQDNSTIIYNPVTVHCTAVESPAKLIITAGRLQNQKNHQLLINAFAKVHERFPEHKLIIYGEGPLRQQLERQVQELGLGECVLLPGNVDNIHTKMSEAELFVLTSNFEGMSNALMEAMAIGTPCISTDCQGSDELITDGHNGRLIHVGDEAALTAAMLQLLEDPAYAKALGAQARADSSRYSTDNIIGQWREVIEG